MGNLPPYAMQNGTCTKFPVGSNVSWSCCPGSILGDTDRNAGIAIAMPVFLGWIFMGVALGADAFMASVETITSQTRLTTITINGVKKRFHTRVWNDTIANLTLMALGSSAPEIMISTLEVINGDKRGRFRSGELGPSTIVGSAAFNLMVIIAVCISALPNGETRTLKHLGVFGVTATFSVFAYVWLVIILVWWTPNLVTLTEAALTFSFMLVLVAVAYIADKGWLSKVGPYASRRLRVLNVKADPSSPLGDTRSTPVITATEVARYLKKLQFESLNSVDAVTPESDTRLRADSAPVWLSSPCVSAQSSVRESSAEASPKRLSLIESEDGEEADGVAANGDGVPSFDLEAVPSERFRERSKSKHERIKNDKRRASVATVTALSAEAIARGITKQQEATKPKSRVQARREALPMFSSKRSSLSKSSSIDEGVDGPPDAAAIVSNSSITMAEVEWSTFVGFPHAAVTVTEGNDAYATVPVARSGCMQGTLSVAYATLDGTARAASDYKAVSGTLTFLPGETTKEVKVQIIDDDEIEDDEEFYIQLSEPIINIDAETSSGHSVHALCPGPRLFGTCTVIIKDDDVQPGTLRWKHDAVRVCESEHFVTLVLERRKGHNGEVTVKYDTKQQTAVEGVDYVGQHGTLTLAHGQMSASLEIPIIDDTSYEKDETFLCILSDPTGGATFPADTDGREDSEICTITIESNGDIAGKVDRVLELLRIEHTRDLAHKCTDEWRQQFVDALYWDDDSDFCSKFIHVIMVPWKLAFALCPPADLCSGWALFVVALVGIALQVILIDEVAKATGCQWNLSTSVAAITLVALGTSLPDLFASMKAARDDPTADNSIGNVTGSNSVNVFLGLGLPWLIAACYWQSVGPTDDWVRDFPSIYADYVNPATRRFSGGENGGYVVCAGSLAFSVTVFAVCAVITITTIIARRYCFSPSAELGGPQRSARLTSAFFILLWLVYIVFSIIRDLEVVPSWTYIKGLSTEGSCP